MVVKTKGGRESFDPAKIVSGVMAAAKGRPIDAEMASMLAESVEEELRLSGSADVTSLRVGVAVLERLRDLDDVTYLRFASVYKNFDAAEDFQREVALLDKTPIV